MKTALLIIDMQNDFFRHERLQEHKDDLVKYINELCSFCRSKDMPVIWITQTMKKDMSDAPLWNKKTNTLVLEEGTKGAELLDGLDTQEDDYNIIKKRFSGFFKTDLEKLLQDFGVDRLIIAGINTMTCVRTTAIDAYMRDYEVILALDCVDGYDKVQHDTSLTYLQYSVAEGKTNKGIFELLSNSDLQV